MIRLLVGVKLQCWLIFLELYRSQWKIYIVKMVSTTSSIYHENFVDAHLFWSYCPWNVDFINFFGKFLSIVSKTTRASLKALISTVINMTNCIHLENCRKIYSPDLGYTIYFLKFLAFIVKIAKRTRMTKLSTCFWIIAPENPFLAVTIERIWSSLTRSIYSDMFTTFFCVIAS